MRDPIDTSTQQGKFSLRVHGAVAQLERTLIPERTKAGIKAAKARGKLPSDPGLREHRRDADVCENLDRPEAKTAATFFARFESFSPASVTLGDHATSKADSRFVSMKAELLHG